MRAAALAGSYASESELCERWAAGLRPPLRLEDGRALRVVFPGVPGGGKGPDFTGAIVDAGGDVLRGDVEMHLRASGWRDHGHARDEAYTRVVLHVVAENDTGALTTLHATGRAVAVLVLPSQRGQAAFPPPFTPPCALAAAGEDPGLALARMGERRLRLKAARILPVVAAEGPGQALYALALELLGGPSNRAAFAALARRLPLAALLDAGGGSGDRSLVLAAALKGAALQIMLRRAGLRPMASPVARLEAAGRLAARLWPAGCDAGWPDALRPAGIPAHLRVAGIGRDTSIELAVNAVLPVALASGAWSEREALSAWRSLPSPATYGKLRRLEGWLNRPFRTASALQGGILLHGDYCTRGMCGRCPLSG